MDQYVNTCELTCNGQKIDDFNTFSEDPRVLRQAVKLMKKTGRAGVTPRYGFKVGYVVPANKPEFNFDVVEDGTFTVEYDGGQRVTFGDVNCAEIGAPTTNGENETVKEISFFAGSRTVE